MEATSRPNLPKGVISLGVVSLLNDAASEAIYPFLPAFIATLGGGPETLGVIEGAAEAVASSLKLGSGFIADRTRRLKGLAALGYGLANLVRPLLAIARAPMHVLAIRTTDRIGKGLRTPPRDALLAAQVGPELRGRAFGFHRAMDHTGAFIGPALAFLLVRGGLPLRHLFAWSAVPGALAVLVLLLQV